MDFLIGKMIKNREFQPFSVILHFFTQLLYRYTLLSIIEIREFIKARICRSIMYCITHFLLQKKILQKPFLLNIKASQYENSHLGLNYVLIMCTIWDYELFIAWLLQRYYTMAKLNSENFPKTLILTFR